MSWFIQGTHRHNAGIHAATDRDTHQPELNLLHISRYCISAQQQLWECLLLSERRRGYFLLPILAKIGNGAELLHQFLIPGFKLVEPVALLKELNASTPSSVLTARATLISVIESKYIPRFTRA